MPVSTLANQVRPAEAVGYDIAGGASPPQMCSCRRPVDPLPYGHEGQR